MLLALVLVVSITLFLDVRDMRHAKNEGKEVFLNLSFP